MRFLVDECAGGAVAELLRHRGHDVVSVAKTALGSGDEQVLRKAAAQQRIIITADTGFGERVFRGRMEIVSESETRISKTRQ